jgi:O-antigen/teichoic acid export membrane protein
MTPEPTRRDSAGGGGDPVHADDSTGRSMLRRHVTSAFAVNVVGLITVAGGTWVLARLLGATGYGAYQYGYAWVDVLALLAVLGFDKLAMREVAVLDAARTGGDPRSPSLIRGFLRRADQLSGLGALVFAGAAGLLMGWLRPELDPHLFPCFWILLLLLPLRALMHVRRGALLGVHETVRAQVPLLVLQPFLTVAFVALAALVLAGDVGPTQAAIAAVAAGAVALGAGHYWRVQCMTTRGITGRDRAYATRAWVAAALPMMLTAGMSIINLRADVIMVGSLENASAAGVYGVAAQVALLARFGLLAVNPALAPIAARLHAARDAHALQQRATAGARAAFAVALAVLAGVWLGGEWVLGLFGDAFPAGRDALLLLAVLHLVTVGFGACESLLLMTGHQVAVTMTAAIATLLNLGLNAVLIPHYGLEGAALATGLSLVLWSFAMAIGVWHWLGIDPTVVGRAGRDRGDRG